ncbi:MAG: carbon-nitrogen hydrolase family protein [Rhodospirillales bacterium]|jgi:predicted amidohydrolase|nr:carbon-nitrogen hydrolase family protein [Rhodospirillales bacterium]
MARCLAACVQTNSSREVGPNIEAVLPLIGEACGRGAEFILLPENVAMIEPIQAKQREKALPEAGHPALPALAEEAAKRGVWILIGSLAVLRDDGRVANRSLLIDSAGRVVARYDKIHLFDVDLGPKESYRESAVIAPGDVGVVAETPWGRLGMSVCYDLRFPQLYRALAKAGADFIAIPAAFTRTTGAAHWHVLVRARAIETGCYVLAPAQTGTHAEGRLTFGHSLIVDPWGVVLADAGEDVGIVTAELDPERVADARRRVPALMHDRDFAPPPPS